MAAKSATSFGKKYKPALYITAAGFVLMGLILAFMSNDTSKMAFGLCAPLLLLVPWGLHWKKIKVPMRFYILFFLFLILAYDIGFVSGGYDRFSLYDKFVHGLSGCYSMSIGCFIYLYLNKKVEAKKIPMLLFGLFFSLSVGLLCEFIECSVYLISGFDAQHTLTTGVFDTMGDLLACLIGTLLQIVLYTLYFWKGIKLFHYPVIEEFRAQNNC